MMGTSCWEHISTAVGWIRELRPASVLDVGVGFGKWGFLCREYLDVWCGSTEKSEWRTRIVGIEGFEPYVHPGTRYVYDEVLIGDATEKIHEAGLFDLVIMADILEHFTRHWANCMLVNAVAISKAVLIVTPGSKRPQDALNGNEYERHRSVVKRRHMRAMFPILKHEDFESGGWMVLLEGHQAKEAVNASR